ncbi:TrmH family RNA methyltransferase [Salinactinospora qingdaonensis]|uniref:RNA methyltransferase n=1 Tax=Salinactinospora qingdaonensis TaxID=702744 RepID=A0ABP7F0P7_9ACTN
MSVIEISDGDDERLADYMRLRDVNLRKRLETEHGLFMAEGEKVIRRALRAGYLPRSLLLTRRRIATLGDVVEAVDAPTYLVTEETARRTVGFDLHRGALASFHRRALPDVVTVLRGARNVVVLEDVVDHTNVGAIFRSAAGLGVDAVVLAPRCADPLYRRAVKVSMGAVFTLPYARLTDWYAGLRTLREQGFTLLALTPDPTAPTLGRSLATAGPDNRHALLLGTEGDGLSSRWLSWADVCVRIPMAQREVDSLNVTAAAAIACYELAQAGG